MRKGVNKPFFLIFLYLQNTFIVLVKNLDEVSVKVEMAIKLGVDVLSRDDFIGKYI